MIGAHLDTLQESTMELYNSLANFMPPGLLSDQLKASSKANSSLTSLSFSNIQHQLLHIPVSPEFDLSFINMTTSANWSWVACAQHNGCVKIWDLTTGAELELATQFKSDCSPRWCAVSFSPDGSAIAIENKTKVKIWCTQTGVLKQEINLSGKAVNKMLYHPHGTQIALTLFDSCTVALWNIQTGEWDLTLEANLSQHKHSWIQSITYSPDGSLLAAGMRNGTVHIWDTTAGNLCASRFSDFSNYDYGVNSLAFSLDEAHIAYPAYLFDHWLLWIWQFNLDVVDLELTPSSAMELSIVAWLSNSIAYLSVGALYLWDCSKKNPQCIFHSNEVQDIWGKHIAVSPDDSQVVLAGKDAIRIFNATSHSSQGTVWVHSAQITCVTFSTTGAYVASISKNGVLLVWDASSGAVSATFQNDSSYQHSLVFSPDECRLASVSAQGVIHIWDMTTRALQIKLCDKNREQSTKRALKIAFSSDSMTMATSPNFEAEVDIWDCTTWTRRATLAYDKPPSQWVPLGPL